MDRGFIPPAFNKDGIKSCELTRLTMCHMTRFMQYTVRTISREFTASEVDAITGVSPSLQRNWRRYGYLPENEGGKWTRYSLDWVIRIAVMKLLSDAGTDVSKTSVAAQMAIPPTLDAIMGIAGAVVFEGHDVPEEERQRIIALDGSYATGRYIVSYGYHELAICRVSSLADIEEDAVKERRPVFSVVDTHALALLIAERAGGPVVRYEIEMPSC